MCPTTIYQVQHRIRDNLPTLMRAATKEIQICLGATVIARRNATPPPLQTPLNDIHNNESAIDFIAFYWSFGPVYVMVLLTLVIVLWINLHWRRAWFYYINMCLEKNFGRFFEDVFFCRFSCVFAS